MTPRVGYVLLSLLAPLTLWHHVAWRRGAAYLLLGMAAPRWAVAVAHAAGALAGATLALRAREVPPWRGPRLLVAAGVWGASSLVGAFFAMRVGAFTAFACAAAAGFGALLGALAATQARTLPSLQFSREGLLDALTIEVLGPAVVASIVWMLAADRVGPLRAGLVLAIGCCLVGHMGAAQVAPLAAASWVTRRAAARASYGLAVGLALVEPLTPIGEVDRLPDTPVSARSGGAAGARVVLTSGRGAFQLYVDGLLRMSTLDAARRAEATVHPAMLAAARRDRVLLLGGGDGASLREILRHGDAREVLVVEPDEALVAVARENAVVQRVNGGAFASQRVRVLARDPMDFVSHDEGRYDVIVVDLLDPETPRRSKLYTSYFYGLLRERLAEGGVVGVATSASPFHQRRAFWCIVATLEHAGFAALPYRVGLPSWGVFGLALAARQPVVAPAPERYEHVGPLAALDGVALNELFHLAPDEQRVPVEPNLLHRQTLLRYRGEDR